ncbi:lysyl oxidase family protein [Halovivax limisalsi]|uniref:lysyl oxidase family protein n=1 Tax=Halovivax limisalsi TaxID=1453760 RepID=UPI001FFD291F|nr:lysyl oxidase family protein [Halovivax limisalsi]
MKGNWSDGRAYAAALVGTLIIAVACAVALGGVGMGIEDPFSENSSGSGTDTAATDGTEGAEEAGTTPADEASSTSPPSTLIEPDPEPPDDRAGDEPGVNFVPGIEDFTISTEEFDRSSPDVEDGYVTPGEHRLLRFDMIIYNVGAADAELGRPENRPDLFVHSDSHGHAHLKGFNTYTLFDESGGKMDVGKKQTFCLRDNFRIPQRSNVSSSPQYDCDYQGISAGWADVYDSSLPGQYLVIDGVPDGNYTLQATTNAEGTLEETCSRDNTVRVDLRIENGTVTLLDTQHRSRAPFERPLAADARSLC